MPAVTKITKVEKAAHAAYVENGGSRSLKQYVALSRGRAKSPVTAKLAAAKSAKPTTHKLAAPVSEVLRTALGLRVDFMGGRLVVDEAGANQLIAELSAAGFSPKQAGFQNSKRRGLRMQVSVDAGLEQAALAVAEQAGFKTWIAA